jgi:hypothetical protein
MLQWSDTQPRAYAAGLIWKYPRTSISFNILSSHCKQTREEGGGEAGKRALFPARIFQFLELDVPPLRVVGANLGQFSTAFTCQWRGQQMELEV